MKTSYYLATAAVLAAAAVTVFAQLPPPPPAAPPGLPALPPVSTPPDVALPPLSGIDPVVPVAPPPKPVTRPEPWSPALPVVPPPIVSPMLPVVPPPPAASQSLPVIPPPMPSQAMPIVPPPMSSQALPVVPPPIVPPVNESGSVPPIIAPPPVELQVPPSKPAVAPSPKPLPLAAPTPVPAAVAEKPKGPARFLVTSDAKLVEGVVTQSGEKYVVRRGSLDQTYTKEQAKFVGHTKDEVRDHMLGQIDKKDAAARMKLARWCMFNGMRPQALAEAREVTKLQPENTAAADMVRSLEESLKKFPEEGTPAVIPAAAEIPAPPPPAVPPPVRDADPDVTPDGAVSFATKMQPLLANLCADCHAKPGYDGAFKLARTTGYDYSATTTRQNLLAVAAQLKKDDPAASPLLAKALVAHGGMKEPAISSRQHPAYRNLEAWVSVAVPPVVAQAEPRALPALTASPLAASPPPASPLPPAVVQAGGFGAEAKVETPTGPSPTNTGAAVDEFDPSVFNRAVHPGKGK